MNALKKAMAELEGRQPDDLAHYFWKLGIKGERITSNRCPVAVFLKRRTGHDACVGPDGITLWLPSFGGPFAFGHLRRQDVKTPENVREFLYRFDSGTYPQLDRTPVERWTRLPGSSQLLADLRLIAGEGLPTSGVLVP